MSEEPINLINAALLRSEGIGELVYSLGELAELNNSMEEIKPECLTSAAGVILEELGKIRAASEALFDDYRALKQKGFEEPPLIGRHPPATAGEA